MKDIRSNCVWFPCGLSTNTYIQGSTYRSVIWKACASGHWSESKLWDREFRSKWLPMVVNIQMVDWISNLFCHVLTPISYYIPILFILCIVLISRFWKFCQSDTADFFSKPQYFGLRLCKYTQEFKLSGWECS